MIITPYILSCRAVSLHTWAGPCSYCIPEHVLYTAKAASEGARKAASIMLSCTMWVLLDELVLSGIGLTADRVSRLLKSAAVLYHLF